MNEQVTDNAEVKHEELVDSLIRYGIGGGMGYPEGAVEGALEIVKKSRWLAAHDREVAAQAIETARDKIMPPVNWNLRHDGTETPGTAVVDGVYHDVHRELSECADALRSGTAPTPT